MKRNKQKRSTKNNFIWDVTCKPNKNPQITFNDLLAERVAVEGEDGQSESQKLKIENLKKILKSSNFVHPSPIQVEAIPIGLKGRNIIAQSQSGTGKTISFLSLVFAKIEAKMGFQGLIITPTRELADQIYNLTLSLNNILDNKSQIKVALLIGGLPLDQDLAKFRQGVDLIIGTTGRTMLHFQEKNIDFQRLRLVVLDEADVLIKGREFRKLFGAIRHERDKRMIQICAFSATFGRKNLLKYCRFLYPCVKIHNDCYIEKKKSKKNSSNSQKNFKLQEVNLDSLDQFYIEVEKNNRKSESLVKMDWVVKILKMINFEQAIVFYNDKGRGDQIVEELKEAGIYKNSVYFHGDLNQAQRIRIMNRIRLKSVKIIIATDVLSRGIDLESIDLVINFSNPYSPETYFHRVGRTARFGNYGVSFLLMSFKDRIEFLRHKEFKFRVTEFEDDVLEEVNEKLRVKREEREEREGKERKVRRELKNRRGEGVVGGLPQWVDSGVEVYDPSKFSYMVEEKKEDAAPDWATGDLDGGKGEGGKVNVGKRDLEFESEMLEMEIKRIEKEERDLLGLREDEQLSQIHQCEDIDQKETITLSKRPQIEVEIDRPEADYQTFKQLFNYLECQHCVESIDRMEHMLNFEGGLTVFKKLADDILS